MWAPIKDLPLDSRPFSSVILPTAIPPLDLFDIKSMLPLGAGFFFALYQVITKKASEYDSDETSLFFTSIFGLVIITTIALYFWHPLTYFSFFI